MVTTEIPTKFDQMLGTNHRLVLSRLLTELFKRKLNLRENGGASWILNSFQQKQILATVRNYTNN